MTLFSERFLMVLRRCALTLAALGAATLGSPAVAALKIQVSRPTTAVYQSVGITVADSRRGLDVPPGPISVTMADGRDRRQTFFLQSTGTPGEYYGRFTPTSAGRFTGTVVLHRKDSTEIGLVPVVQVRGTVGQGFYRFDPASPRVLARSAGSHCFPIGVSIDAAAVRVQSNWQPELERLRQAGVNYLDVGIEWAGRLTPDEKASMIRSVDQLLMLAEQNGNLGVQLRLEGPLGFEAASDEYLVQTEEWIQRWSYSPAVAAWFLSPLTPDVPDACCEAVVRAVRKADAYRHVVCTPESHAGGPRAGADLSVGAWRWDQPELRPGIRLAGPLPEGVVPLPGETNWQHLALGGTGLPLHPYLPGADDDGVLNQARVLSRVASEIPFSQGAAPVRQALDPDIPGALCRYGKVYIGWLVGPPGKPMPVGPMARGRFRVRLFDPANGKLLSSNEVVSEGRNGLLTPPAGYPAIFFQIDPVSPTTAAATHSRPRPTAARSTSGGRVPAARPSTSTTKKSTKKPTKKPAKKPTKKPSRATSSRRAKPAAAKKPVRKQPTSRKKPTSRKRPTPGPTRRTTATVAKKKPSSTKKAVTKKPRRAGPSSRRR